MNYLQLAQRLHQEIAGGPNDPGTDPDAVTSLSGELLRYASWIQAAWIDIQQERPDWRWMWRSATLETSSGTREYAPNLTNQTGVALTSINRSGTTATATTTTSHGFSTGDRVAMVSATGTGFEGVKTITVVTATTFTYTVSSSLGASAILLPEATATLIDFGQVWPHSAFNRPFIRCYLAATGVTDSQPIYYRAWRDFGGYLDAGNQTQTGRPTLFSVKPDGTLTFSPIPDATYGVTIPYCRNAQNLVLATDVPDMPAEYHMLIVWRALLYYGTSNEANRASAQAQLFYSRLMHKLKTTQIGAVGY